jgi:hypothetical protein
VFREFFTKLPFDAGIQFTDGSAWGRILASLLVWVRREAGKILTHPELFRYTVLCLPLDASRCMMLEAVPTPVCIEEFSTHLQNTLARMHGLRSVGFFLKKQMFFGCSGQWEQELTPAGRQMFGGTHCKAVSPGKPHMHNGNLCTASHKYFVSSTPAAAKAAFTMTLDKIQGPRCMSSH